MLPFLLAVMILSEYDMKRLSPKRGWSSYFTIKVHFILMMAKDGYGQRRATNPYDQRGRGIMVSDYIDEHNGYLGLTDQEYEDARVNYTNLWKYGRFLLRYESASEGYWNSENVLIQVKQAITIAEIKYPSCSHNIVFLFDQSSGHVAYAVDSFNVNRMNVNLGGNQPKMRDTVWDGRVQKMVDSKGTPKGMRQVLMQRGIDVSGMKADDMRKALKEMHNFKYEKTKVESMISARGHQCIFIPKYHCELTPLSWYGDTLSNIRGNTVITHLLV